MPRTLHHLVQRPIATAAFVLGLASLAAGVEAQRLPQTVRPEHYRLLLTPNLKAATFTGDEAIDVMLLRPSRTITLNAAELTFTDVKATTEGNVSVTGTVTLDSANEQAILTFPVELPSGKTTLAIQYTGILNDDLRGFYVAKTDRHNYAVTSFESTNARRAFPSFDEPAFKATFDIALTVDAGDMAISNSAVLSDRPAPAIAGVARHTVVFATTPRMSTYLVAFLVGDFECISGASDAIPIRVCATPGKREMSRFALSAAEYDLHYYDDYFGIPYPLSKLDMIALPDFGPGGLENFGAITYRETLLLLDEETATLDQKKDVASTVAHELAHQWFGDLVTMQWWDNLWLNEGFATWMAIKPVSARHPEWHYSQNNASELQTTLRLDGQSTTHAIRARADTPSEIGAMFDGISYGKAGAMLAMVEHYLGEETFRQGVHDYLAKHEYGNATAEDFGKAEAARSGIPVDRIMASLVEQPGVPLLSFTDHGGGSIGVKQSRFVSDPSASVNDAGRWALPVCFKTNGKPVCEVIAAAAQRMSVPASGFLFANAGAKGYYRSSYSQGDYQKILVNAETSLTPEERIVLIGDELALMHSGAATASDNLDLMAALHDDPNVIVLQNVLGTISDIENQIATDDDREMLRAWVLKEFAPVYHVLGSTPTGNGAESQNRQQLRALIFIALGEAKDSEILTEARALADRYIADQRSVDPTLAASALYIAATNGDAALYDRLLALRASSQDPEVQASSLYLTTHFTDSSLVTRTLDMVTTTKLRNRDNATMLAIMLRNRDTQVLAWTYITRHWDRIQATADARLVGAAGTFCSTERRDEVLHFFETHKIAGAERALKIAGETIGSCVQLRDAQEPNLKRWLIAHS
ncbi:MAG TPA: M1 family metallopeptidase [Gemmatimonadaceae bacterium]|nr:M1 family metallopeptidase [Gemmatimonadaceae bacterium]